MLKMLDEMEIHFNGPDHKFDRKTYKDLQTCMKKYDDNLL